MKMAVKTAVGPAAMSEVTAAQAAVTGARNAAGELQGQVASMEPADIAGAAISAAVDGLRPDPKKPSEKQRTNFVQSNVTTGGIIPAFFEDIGNNVNGVNGDIKIVNINKFHQVFPAASRCLGILKECMRDVAVKKGVTQRANDAVAGAVIVASTAAAHVQSSVKNCLSRRKAIKIASALVSVSLAPTGFGGLGALGGKVIADRCMTSDIKPFDAGAFQFSKQEGVGEGVEVLDENILQLIKATIQTLIHDIIFITGDKKHSLIDDLNTLSEENMGSYSPRFEPMGVKDINAVYRCILAGITAWRVEIGFEYANSLFSESRVIQSVATRLNLQSRISHILIRVLNGLVETGLDGCEDKDLRTNLVEGNLFMNIPRPPVNCMHMTKKVLTKTHDDTVFAAVFTGDRLNKKGHSHLDITESINTTTNELIQTQLELVINLPISELNPEARDLEPAPEPAPGEEPEPAAPGTEPGTLFFFMDAVEPSGYPVQLGVAEVLFDKLVSIRFMVEINKYNGTQTPLVDNFVRFKDQMTTLNEAKSKIDGLNGQEGLRELTPAVVFGRDVRQGMYDILKDKDPGTLKDNTEILQQITDIKRKKQALQAEMISLGLDGEYFNMAWIETVDDNVFSSEVAKTTMRKILKKKAKNVIQGGDIIDVDEGRYDAALEQLKGKMDEAVKEFYCSQGARTLFVDGNTALEHLRVNEKGGIIDIVDTRGGGIIATIKGDQCKLEEGDHPYDIAMKFMNRDTLYYTCQHNMGNKTWESITMNQGSMFYPMVGGPRCQPFEGEHYYNPSNEVVEFCHVVTTNPDIPFTESRTAGQTATKYIATVSTAIQAHIEQQGVCPAVVGTIQYVYINEIRKEIVRSILWNQVYSSMLERSGEFVNPAESVKQAIGGLARQMSGETGISDEDDEDDEDDEKDPSKQASSDQVSKAVKRLTETGVKDVMLEPGDNILQNYIRTKSGRATLNDVREIMELIAANGDAFYDAFYSMLTTNPGDATFARSVIGRLCDIQFVRKGPLGGSDRVLGLLSDPRDLTSLVLKDDVACTLKLYNESMPFYTKEQLTDKCGEVKRDERSMTDYLDGLISYFQNIQEAFTHVRGGIPRRVVLQNVYSSESSDYSDYSDSGDEGEGDELAPRATLVAQPAAAEFESDTRRLKLPLSMIDSKLSPVTLEGGHSLLDQTSKEDNYCISLGETHLYVIIHTSQKGGRESIEYPRVYRIPYTGISDTKISNVTKERAKITFKFEGEEIIMRYKFDLLGVDKAMESIQKKEFHHLQDLQGVCVVRGGNRTYVVLEINPEDNSGLLKQDLSDKLNEYQNVILDHMQSAPQPTVEVGEPEPMPDPMYPASLVKGEFLTYYKERMLDSTTSEFSEEIEAMRKAVRECKTIEDEVTAIQTELLEMVSTIQPLKEKWDLVRNFDETFLGDNPELQGIKGSISSLQAERSEIITGQLPHLDAEVSRFRKDPSQENALETAENAFTTMKEECEIKKVEIEKKHAYYLASATVQAVEGNYTTAVANVEAKNTEMQVKGKSLYTHPGYPTYQRYLKFINMFEDASEDPVVFEGEFDTWMEDDATLDEIIFYRNSFSILLIFKEPLHNDREPRMSGYYIGEGEVTHEQIKDLYVTDASTEWTQLTCVSYHPFLEIVERSKISNKGGDMACQCCFRYDSSLDKQRVSYSCDDPQINKTGLLSTYRITEISYIEDGKRKRMIITITQDHGLTASQWEYGKGGSAITITIIHGQSKLTRSSEARFKFNSNMYEGMPRLHNVMVRKANRVERRVRRTSMTNITLGNLDRSDTSGSRFHLEVAIRGFLEG